MAMAALAGARPGLTAQQRRWPGGALFPVGNCRKLGNCQAAAQGRGPSDDDEAAPAEGASFLPGVSPAQGESPARSGESPTLNGLCEAKSVLRYILAGKYLLLTTAKPSPGPR